MITYKIKYVIIVIDNLFVLKIRYMIIYAYFHKYSYKFITYEIL